MLERVAWALLALLTQGVLATQDVEFSPLLVVFSTNDTDTSLVQDVLSAAGVHMLAPAPKGGNAQQLAQYLQDTIRKGPPRPPAASVQAGGVAGYSLQGSLQDLQAITQVLHSARVMHVVSDVRQAVFEPLLQTTPSVQFNAGDVLRITTQAAALDWAAQNMVVRKLEDLCQSGGRTGAVKTLLRNAGLDASNDTVSRAAAALKDCTVNNWRVQSEESDTNVMAALRAADASIRDALTAFGFVPMTGLGLPTWLEAKAALAEVQELSSSMAADPAPAIVTFVSNGYQPILNNWLAWLKHSGADVARVVVVTPRGHESSVRGKLMYQDVHVVAIDVIEPDVWEPRSSHELGAQKDPNRHARAKVWLQRIRVLYTFIHAGVSVILSDLDAIWMQNAADDLLSKAGGHERGFDLLMSPGYFPFDVHKQMGVVGCMGFLYANATSGTQALLGTMLHEKLHQLNLREVKFYNDQRILNEQLLQSGIATNNTAKPHPRQQGHPEPVLGEQLTTAPDALRVLFLSDVQYARVCSNTTSYRDAVVVHCQSHNSGAAKRAFLHRVGLWKQDTVELQV